MKATEVPCTPSSPPPAVDELDQVLPQGGIFEEIADGVVEEDGVELPRLSGSKTAGSRLTTVSKAPVFCPMSVKARLAVGMEPCPP